MGLPSFLPGGLSAALPRSCLSAVFAQSVGGAGYSVVKVQLGEKFSHIFVNKQGSKSTPLGYLFSGGKVPLYIRTFTPPKVRALLKVF